MTSTAHMLAPFLFFAGIALLWFTTIKMWKAINLERAPEDRLHFSPMSSTIRPVFLYFKTHGIDGLASLWIAGMGLGLGFGFVLISSTK
jgi:hypothetical protein